jgi:hypothetical protein
MKKMEMAFSLRGSILMINSKKKIKLIINTKEWELFKRLSLHLTR